MGTGSYECCACDESSYVGRFSKLDTGLIEEPLSSLNCFSLICFSGFELLVGGSWILSLTSGSTILSCSDCVMESTGVGNKALPAPGTSLFFKILSRIRLLTFSALLSPDAGSRPLLPAVISPVFFNACAGGSFSSVDGSSLSTSKMVWGRTVLAAATFPNEAWCAKIVFCFVNWRLTWGVN